MNRFNWLFVLVSLVWSLPNRSEQIDEIVLWERNFANAFFFDTIKNAAELTLSDYGDYSIVASPPMEQGRAFVSLSSGDLVNVAIAGISSHNERLAKAVYIPIDRGLLGFRVCLTESDHIGFDNVRSLSDFRKQNFTMGVGSHWPDRDVLEANGFPVAHSPVYAHLFDMVKARRFDCFLRSVNEVESEINIFNQDAKLAINNDIGFVYPMADFVFVSPVNPQLHQRIKLGLERSIEDGSFNELFQQYLGNALMHQAFYSRKVIVLNNPDVSIDALDAINELGLASFVKSYGKTD